MAESKTPHVRVRFAPSPTGPLHIGGARTALFNWLFARGHKGKFILRIEDTDKARSEKKWEAELMEGLTWLGLDWDETPERQSERTSIYKKYLEKLLESGDAYYCYCTRDELEAQRDAMTAQGVAPKYSGRCRNLTTSPPGKNPEVIRFKIPETQVEFKDLIRGKVSFDAGLFGDIVIAKDLETPLFNFAVVVDDALMEISHVIRGEEHLSNTPKQILIARALGFPEPIYAHIPLILNPDRSKMSKRFADTALAAYRDRGYLPEALLNFLALLGWHPTGDRELFSRDELVKEFDLARVQPSGAVFNEEKLNWLNREYLKKLSDKSIAEFLLPIAEKHYGKTRNVDIKFLEKIAAAERGRANTLHDFLEFGSFFFALPEYKPDMLIWKDSSREEAIGALSQLRAELTKLTPENFARDTVSAAVTSIIESGKKRGAVLWPFRVALSGREASPDPLDIAEVLGYDESLRRVNTAIDKLSLV